MYFIYFAFCQTAFGLNKFNKETGEIDLQLKSLAAPLRPLYEPVQATEAKTTTETATGVEAKKSTTGYEWLVTEWSRCDIECGTGIQRRKVECRNIDTKGLGEEALCTKDFTMPVATQDCDGECLNCPVSHGDLFKRSSLGSPADPANYAVKKVDEYSLCQVQPDTPASCCTADNEDAIRSEVSRLSKNLDDMMMAIPTLTAVVKDTFTNFTVMMEQRRADTDAALMEVNAAMANGSSDQTRSLPVLKEVLVTRSSYFKTSIDTVKKAVDLVQEQIAGFTDSTEAIENACGKALMTLFAQVSCATCNVDFVKSFVTDGTIRVSEFDCTLLHKSCRSSIAKSHGSLLLALRELSRVHTELRKQAMRLQPALARLWGSLKFTWIPGSIPQDLNKNPDLTQLQCIRQSVMFDLPQISRSNDFCAAYMSPFEAGTFASRVRQSLLQGKMSIDDLVTCDGCVHAVVTRLPTLIVQSAETANLELQFPTEDSHVCLMANRVPKSISLVNTMRAQMLGNREGFVPSSFEEETPAEDTPASTGVAGKPHAPLPLRFVKTAGADVGVIGNLTSWDALVSVGKLIPPRPIWEPESQGLKLQVWDKSCKTHEDCSNQGSTNGEAAWWFCASPGACETGACTPTDVELLSKGARCAKGACVHGAQAADGSCPENSVCPADGASTQFGPKYFEKLQLVRDDDGNPGVCDCAFADAPSQDFTVVDKCKHAACMAYAQSYEDNAACKLKLAESCEALKAAGCRVDCAPEEIAWTPPVCEYSLSGSSVMSSETSVLSSSATTLSVAVAAVASFGLLLLR